MTKLQHTTLLVLVLLLCHCGEREDVRLLGKWQATQVLQRGDSLLLDPAEVGFSFLPNNRYAYRSTLRYQEAGTWRYDNGFLFAQDTTRAAATERIVAVEKLTSDSLVLRMRADTTEQVMILLKQ
ncbi:hypothetical protein [Neolewinella persica]|uniref:hypothetical protein n=1 Tax=Neolewinella persica TaxID=70998 RepID=UPI0003753654|nr:hypothetical protein [Neolewinella persica]